MHRVDSSSMPSKVSKAMSCHVISNSMGWEPLQINSAFNACLKIPTVHRILRSAPLAQRWWQWWQTWQMNINCKTAKQSLFDAFYIFYHLFMFFKLCFLSFCFLSEQVTWLESKTESSHQTWGSKHVEIPSAKFRLSDLLQANSKMFEAGNVWQCIFFCNFNISLRASPSKKIASHGLEDLLYWFVLSTSAPAAVRRCTPILQRSESAEQLWSSDSHLWNLRTTVANILDVTKVVLKVRVGENLSGWNRKGRCISNSLSPEQLMNLQKALGNKKRTHTHIYWLFDVICARSKLAKWTIFDSLEIPWIMRRTWRTQSTHLKGTSWPTV